MTKEKTIAAWLKELPAELKKDIKMSEPEKIDNRKMKCQDLSGALMYGFTWSTQKEGWDFWAAFRDCIIIAEILDRKVTNL